MSQAAIIERLKNSSLPEDAKILLRDLVTYVYSVETTGTSSSEDLATLSGTVVSLSEDLIALSGIVMEL